MKKTSLITTGIFAASLLISSVANAQAFDVYFDHTFEYVFTRNDPPRDFGPIIIIDQNGQSIKAAHSIRITIPLNLYTLWDKNMKEVVVTGTGVTKGKMDAKVVPVYSSNLREVFFPVKADFAKGEEVSIAGLGMRVYRTASSKQYLEMDLNGDKLVDVSDFRGVTISSSEIRTDGTAPFPVTDFKGVYENSKIALTWKDPADLDFERIFIEKSFTRDGKAITKTIELYPKDEKYLDEDVKEGEVVSYKIQARDTSNLSDPLTIGVNAKTPPPVVILPPVVPPVISPPIPQEQPSTLPPETTPAATPKSAPAPVLETVTVSNAEAFLEKFPDVPGNHWAVPAMTYLTTQKPVFGGYSDGTLGINNFVKRAEIAKIAWNAFIDEQAPEEEASQKSLKDVKKEDWFYVYVQALQKMEVIDGYSDGTFQPNKKVNRVEALKILLEAAGIQVEDVSQEELDVLTFTDLKKDAWYLKYVTFASKNGIAKGMDEKTFKPEGEATRGEIAIMVIHILDYKNSLILAP
ncbi:MAG: S-layer homology domain-containing protein [Patescibacteria group bacterium]